MKKRIFFLVAVVILFSGCIGDILEQEKFSLLDIKSYPEPTVEAGDAVKLNYILSTEDEQVFDTSFEEVAENWQLELTHAAEPMTVKVGDGTIIQSLEEALLGMKVGEQKEILIPPESGYGARDEGLIKIFPRTSMFPRTDVLTLDAFRTIFRADPVVGGVYSLNYWNSTVTDFDGDNVTIQNNARNTSQETERGTVHIHVNVSSIAVTLDPGLNSVVQTIDGAGKVISIGDYDYTMDLNHPLAGETVLFFIRVEEIIKPQKTEDGDIVLGEIEFITSMEKARILANETGRPVFLYVHAAWCMWCRKFETDVLSDEDVTAVLNKDFVNVAIDVDVQPGLAMDLNIFGTPTLIFLDSGGSEILRVRGYRDAETFRDILKEGKEES
jgi:FKBP-type peptidyl-prolyl cis-trans isomerase 2